MFEDKMRAIHPGEILREDFLVPLKMTPVAFATMLELPVAVVMDVVNEKRDIGADFALHITRHFGGDVQFWLNLQQSYDRKIALRPSQQRA
jgi:addiction module HigA family antidote